jgi:hypothetical protein
LTELVRAADEDHAIGNIGTVAAAYLFCRDNLLLFRANARHQSNASAAAIGRIG